MIVCSNSSPPLPIPALPEFDAEANFQVKPNEDRQNADTLISFICDDLKKLIKGRVEPATAATSLRVHKLLKSSTDNKIIAELGGDDVAETSFAQMFELIKDQGRSRKGVMLLATVRCFFRNIFYIRDANGILRAVNCIWREDKRDYCIDVYSDEVARSAGNRVFSH